MFKLLLEFGPLVAFFVGYKYGGGITGATLYMLVASIVTIIACYAIERKIQTFSLVSSVILIVSASVTLISGNPMFIKIKPTILYVVSAIILLVSTLRKKPVMRYLLHSTIQLEDKFWNVLSYRFVVFFALMAIVNEFVWRSFPEIYWVKFKVFGALPITVVFILLQIPFILKNKSNIADNSKTPD